MLFSAHTLGSIVFLGDDGEAIPGIPSAVGTGRFVSSDEFDRITSGSYAIFSRVRIADPAGTMYEYSNRDGINWIDSIEIDLDVNQPIGTAVVKLWREVGGRSLAPLRTNSSYNNIPFPEAVLDTFGNTVIARGPSLDAGRRILIDVACPPLGTDPDGLVDSDYHTIFDGWIDVVDWGQNPIKIDARDMAAPIQDTWFPVPNVINAGSFSLPALSIQAAIAGLLDLLHLDVVIPLSVPNPPTPEVDLGTFSYDIEAGMDVVQRVAQVIGWALMARWSDTDQVFRFTFFDPGRAKTTPDYALPPSAYIDITQAKIDVTGIRNDITISYRPNNDTSVDRETVNQRDAESVRRYHTRSMVLQEADDSPINTEDSANLEAELIVFDLSRPVADQIVVMPFVWFVELFDFIRFTPNGVTHDDPLDLGVVTIKHVLQDNQNRTTLEARGRPGSSYWNWLSRRPALPGQTKPQDPTGTTQPGGFASLSQTPDYAANLITLNWAWGGDPTATFEVWVQRGDTGFNLVTTTGTGVLTYVFDPSADIEPFRTPPDAPQIPLEVDFYVRAIVSGSPVGTSATCFASYGDGP